SDDLGSSLSSVPLPISGKLTVLAVAPSDGATIYVGADGQGLAKSSDGGATFSLVGKPSVDQYTAMTVDPSDPLTIYLGANTPEPSVSQPLSGDSGVWKSSDGGQSWTFLSVSPLPSSVNTLAIDPFQHLVVYAALRDQGLYKTVSGGE